MPEHKSARQIIDEYKLDTVVRLVKIIKQADIKFDDEVTIALKMAEKWFGVK